MKLSHIVGGHLKDAIDLPTLNNFSVAMGVDVQGEEIVQQKMHSFRKNLRISFIITDINIIGFGEFV